MDQGVEAALKTVIAVCESLESVQIQKVVTSIPKLSIYLVIANLPALGPVLFEVDLSERQVKYRKPLSGV